MTLPHSLCQGRHQLSRDRHAGWCWSQRQRRPLHSQSRTVKLAPVVFIQSTRGPDHSGTAPTPLSLSNWFTDLDESAPDVHVMIDGSVGSTESDTISLAGEPRTRRRRLSLVWDTHNPEAREEESLRVPVQVR